MSHPSAGRFVWIDVMSKDKDADIAFFGELLGWTFHEQDMGDFGSYTVLQAGDQGVGGIVAMPPEEEHPSHLVGYCGVEDLETALSASDAAGGRTFVPPSPIPGVGTFAVVGDPSGAVYAPLQPATGEDMSPASPPGPGSFVWWELVTGDIDAAADYYGRVLGWQPDPIDMAGQPYWLWSREGQEGNPGGLMRPPEGYDGPGFWLYYVWVEDVDAAAGRVEALGGQLIMPPVDVSGQGRIAVVASPSGAQLGVFTPSPRD